MAMRAAMQRRCYEGNGVAGYFRRLSHSLSISPSFFNSINPISSPTMAIPESKDEPETGFSPKLPGFPPGLGSMDLMAVPKKKVSKHKRGIRNGPKALKPTPVIIRCKCCGRVKLPHFYCCGGRREEPAERSEEVN